MKTYEVTWNIKLTRTIEAGSKREAVEISEDMGNAGVEDPAPDYEVSAMKATTLDATVSSQRRLELKTILMRTGGG